MAHESIKLLFDAIKLLFDAIVVVKRGKLFFSFYNLMSRYMFKGHCKNTKTPVPELLYAVPL